MPRHFALVPAAGSGSRLGGELPKQYALLAGRPVLYHSLRRLALHPSIAHVFVVLAPGDEHFRKIAWNALDERVSPLYCGGETRAASVFNGLVATIDQVEPDDWILVHDAARPCLTATALQRLIDEVGEHDAGGLLAIPVADTLKRAGEDRRVLETAPRKDLWRAQTPQMFRYSLLVEALRRSGPANVTDEASAVERAGVKPKLVMGEARNLKVTYAEDLELASVILERDARIETEMTLTAGMP